MKSGSIALIGLGMSGVMLFLALEDRKERQASKREGSITVQVPENLTPESILPEGLTPEELENYWFEATGIER